MILDIVVAFLELQEDRHRTSVDAKHSGARLSALYGIQDILFDLLVCIRPRSREHFDQMESLVESDVAQLRVVMDERTRRSTDDRAVGVGASRGLLTICVQTFAMEVAGEDGGLHLIIGSAPVTVENGL